MIDKILVAIPALANLAAFVYMCVTWLAPVLNITFTNIGSLTLWSVVGALLMIIVWFPITMGLILMALGIITVLSW